MQIRCWSCNIVKIVFDTFKPLWFNFDIVLASVMLVVQDLSDICDLWPPVPRSCGSWKSVTFCTLCMTNSSICCEMLNIFLMFFYFWAKKRRYEADRQRVFVVIVCTGVCGRGGISYLRFVVKSLIDLKRFPNSFSQVISQWPGMFLMNYDIQKCEAMYFSCHVSKSLI